MSRSRRRFIQVAVAASCLGGMLAIPLVSAGGASFAATALHGRGSVEEAWLTGARPRDSIELRRDGVEVGKAAAADALGSLIIRDLHPGSGYRWVDETSNETTPAFSVLARGANPAVNSSLYTTQPMHKGLNYIRMRDGIKLAATVRYPYGVTCTAKAPCPTVIEYSGYNVAGPTDPIPYVIAGATGGTCTPRTCGDPNLLPDSSTYVGAVVARTSGFATVSLQMRGTGCSGGAYDLFGYPSDYDAYDAIEIVAHQAWVAHHHVGMVGISYSGLSELPSAGTDPPGLAAIAPLSPTDDLFSTGFPGGIYNDGFSKAWIAQRSADAKPAAAWSKGHLVRLASKPVSNVAQPWTYYEIDAELAASHGASSTCLANQALHDEVMNTSFLDSARLVAPETGPGREASIFDRRSMRQWATHITAPVYLAGALEDDETGPQWPALLSAIPKTTPVFATMVNGGHIDSTMPQILSRWVEFLDIYVADQVPHDPGALGDLVLDEFEGSASGAKDPPLPAFRFTKAASLAVAEREFIAHTPRVRVLFDNGAGSVGAGDPESTYAGKFASWPPPGTVQSLYLGAAGALSPTAPTAAGSTSFTLDPSARPAVDMPPGGNPWAPDPPWNWTPVPAADGLGFQTAPFADTTTIVGPATLELYVEAAVPVEDFQATITEVRPGAGDEEYVTSGYLRSANQVDLPDSTRLYTDPTYLGKDDRKLSSTAYSLVKIPIDPIAHTFPAGTELRVVLSAPGGDRPSWAFDTLDNGQQATVGFGGAVASALVVNVVRVRAPNSVPVCGTLRGEPCRTYQAEGNQS